jgi:hypothetical protein
MVIVKVKLDKFHYNTECINSGAIYHIQLNQHRRRIPDILSWVIFLAHFLKKTLGALVQKH